MWVEELYLKSWCLLQGMQTIGYVKPYEVSVRVQTSACPNALQHSRMQTYLTTSWSFCTLAVPQLPFLFRIIEGFYYSCNCFGSFYSLYFSTVKFSYISMTVCRIIVKAVWFLYMAFYQNFANAVNVIDNICFTFHCILYSGSQLKRRQK